MKLCARCRIEKELREFTFIKSKKKYHSYCKPCRVQYNTLTCTRTNEEKTRASRNSKLKKNYGISQIIYEEQYTFQEGKCLICDILLSEKDKRNIHIDHNHDTGSLRGILCSNCNHGLGLFKENIHNMKKAIQYLENNGNWKNA